MLQIVYFVMHCRRAACIIKEKVARATLCPASVCRVQS